MGMGSQRHAREIHGRDSAGQINIKATGGGYGGGAVLPGDGLVGKISPWPAPTNLTVVSNGATTSSMSWSIPSPDPGDGSAIFGYLMTRNGQEVFQANLTSPQTDTGPLEDGEDYEYVIRAYDSLGRLTASDTFLYTHTATLIWRFCPVISDFTSPSMRTRSGAAFLRSQFHKG